MAEEQIMYCDKIKEVIENKKTKKLKMLENLEEIKTEGNYGKTKTTEIQIQLLQQQIKQEEIILETILLECPKDITDYQITCEHKCKWYYNFIIKKE